MRILMHVIDLFHVIDEQLTHLDFIELDRQIEGRVDLILAETLIEEIAQIIAVAAECSRVQVELGVVQA